MGPFFIPLGDYWGYHLIDVHLGNKSDSELCQYIILPLHLGEVVY